MGTGIREMTPGEQSRVIDYFLNADRQFLHGMGVDPAKLPGREEWHALISGDLDKPLMQRQFYYLFWEKEGIPVGHSNINKIRFGREAFMHLHVWDGSLRQKGLGHTLVRQCITQYFTKFQLKRLLCEPRAENPGPNRTLEKLGFTLEKTYDTTPGWINYYQTVNRWVLEREGWKPLRDRPGPVS
ncbi:MAG: GNAT family N-acetyltransferase [Desulfobacterales bacterium]|nr:GNAT family N-acetyltransferase [Desulfobacterales bacterium]